MADESDEGTNPPPRKRTSTWVHFVSGGYAAAYPSAISPRRSVRSPAARISSTSLAHLMRFCAQCSPLLSLAPLRFIRRCRIVIPTSFSTVSLVPIMPVSCTPPVHPKFAPALTFPESVAVSRPPRLAHSMSSRPACRRSTRSSSQVRLLLPQHAIPPQNSPARPTVMSIIGASL